MRQRRLLRYPAFFIMTGIVGLTVMTAGRGLSQESDTAGAASASSHLQSSGEGKDMIIDVLDLKSMEVLDVLKLISQKSGLNIVAAQDVKGRVTVYLRNIKVMDTLKIIVDAYGWAYEKDGDIIKVITAKDFEAKYGHPFGETVETRMRTLVYAASADVLAVLNQMKSSMGKIISDEKSNSLILIDTPRKLDELERVLAQVDVPTETRVFTLSYAKAEEVSNKITESLTPTLGRMKFDDRSNKIIVTDTPRKIGEVVKIIEAFDQKDREVLIEAKILQIVLSDQFQMGVDWEAVVDKYHTMTLVGDFSVLTDTDKRGKFKIGTLSDDSYEAVIEALDTVGQTNILSNPRITAINNKEAKILVGSTEPYVTSTTTTPSSGPTTTAESVNFIEVGVKLFVTPTIHEDDFITMKIKPEVSSVTKTIKTGTNNTIPVVETSEAETTVAVKNGVTIVIGGLIKEESIAQMKKIPLLGDIPVLGMAFRSQDDLTRKTEIVVFLTPRIITGDVHQNAALEAAP